MIFALAQAAAEPSSNDALSKLLAPGGGIALFIAAIWAVAQQFRKGREARVAEAEEAEEAARLRQGKAEKERDDLANVLRKRISELEIEMDQKVNEWRLALDALEERHRAALAAQEGRHRSELAAERTRREEATAEDWRLRTLLTRRGYDPDTGEQIAPTAGHGDGGSSV